MERSQEFKATSVDAAIEKGLKKMNLSIEDVEVEVLEDEGGIFSRATVKITPKEDVEVAEVEETDEAPEEEVVSEQESKPVRREGNRRHDRPRERREYFPEEKAKGKEFIEGITKFFDANSRVDAKAMEDELCFYIGGENANMYIGHRGETLDAIQYLAGQVVNKDKEGEHIRVTVDADFYRERRKRILTGLARRVAEDAYRKKAEIAMEPMNSYERRIIHSALQNSEYASTRSEGEGKYRHVVIVPKCEVMTYGNVNAEFRKKGPSKTKSYGQKRMKF